MRTTRVKITAIHVNWQGAMLARYMNETCFLRTARNVGDEETVNNFVLGRLKEQMANGCIAFEKIV